MGQEEASNPTSWQILEVDQLGLISPQSTQHVNGEILCLAGTGASQMSGWEGPAGRKA